MAIRGFSRGGEFGTLPYRGDRRLGWAEHGLMDGAADGFCRQTKGRDVAAGHGGQGIALDWVLFLDGREAEETVDWSTEAGFRDSWRRPKWEILLR